MKSQIFTIDSKLASNHTCLAVTSLGSALKNDDNHYPQVFLKECKYIEKKGIRHFNDNFSHFSSDDDESDWSRLIFFVSQLSCNLTKFDRMT